MSSIVRDFKATNQEVSIEERVLNVILAFPDTEYWQSFSLIMVYNKNIMTFEATSKHVEMEDER